MCANSSNCVLETTSIRLFCEETNPKMRGGLSVREDLENHLN